MQNPWNFLKQEIAKSLEIDTKNIEEPKEFGDFAFPCFNLARKQRKKPEEIAKDMESRIKIKGFEIKAVGPYLNFSIDWKVFGNNILKDVSEKYGGNFVKKGSALIEHTSINPNASPHVGRARNAIIGDSLVRMLKFAGYKVEVHYYVNDVGKQIALLVFGCRENDKKMKFEDLLKIYIEANKKMEENKDVEKEVFNLLSNFERGDKKTMKNFKDVVSLCVNGQVKILSELNIEYDFFDYESQYLINRKTEQILKMLEKTGKLFTDEDGRKVLDLKGHGLPDDAPPLVLTRSDGTSLYALRDIAYNIDKISKTKGVNIVVLGEDQKLYAQQVFTALKILGYEPPKVVHYSFVLLSTGKMSTRKGNLVLLSDFIKEAYEKALDEISKRYPKLSRKEKETRAKSIALASVRYSIVKVSPESNVIFSLEDALRFEGDTGPYLQYTYVRAKSILEKSKLKSIKYDSNNLVEKKEQEILKLISQFPDIVEKSAKDYRPHYLANYLHNLAETFNQFYQSIQVLHAENKFRDARLKLVESVKIILKTGLSMLGIPVVEKM